MVDLYPVLKFTCKTALSPRDICQRLALEVEPYKLFRFSLTGIYRSLPYEGVFNDSGFVIQRAIRPFAGNRMPLQIIGKILPEKTGSQVSVTIRHHGLSYAGISVIYLLLIGVFIFFINGVIQKKADLIAVFAPALIAVVSWLLIGKIFETQAIGIKGEILYWLEGRSE